MESVDCAQMTDTFFHTTPTNESENAELNKMESKRSNSVDLKFLENKNAF